MQAESESKKYRIALLAGSYDRRRDGVSVYIENLLAAMLAEAQRRRWRLEIEVFGCRGPLGVLRSIVDRNIQALDERVQVSYQAINGTGVLARTAGLSSVVWHRRPYDLCILPNLQPLLLPGPTVSILHDLTYQVAREHFSERRFRYMDWLTRLRLRHDDALGVISQTTRMHLLHYYPEAWRTPLLHVPNGLPETKLGERPPPVAVRDAIGAEPLQLVFCGRLNRLKGVDRLIAFARLLDVRCEERGGPAPILHLVGKATAETESLLDDLDFRHLRLVRHGFLDDAELNRLYRKSAFALFLSRNEGFGLPVIEAAWLGAIPLVSDIPIFAEVLGAGFPRFGDRDEDLRAMLDFIDRLRRDTTYRERILAQIETSLAAHRPGYGTAAATLLDCAAGARDPAHGERTPDAIE